MRRRAIKNIQIKSLNVTITDMINVIVVLTMIEMAFTMMKASTLDIMTILDIFTTISSFNIILDTPTTIESI